MESLKSCEKRFPAVYSCDGRGRKLLFEISKDPTLVARGLIDREVGEAMMANHGLIGDMLKVRGGKKLRE